MGTTTRDGRIDHAGGRLSYMPALDGLRALAVIAVLLYHGDVSWARGGYFGVDAFFVLSGFLITSLLLGEWRPRRRDRPAGVLDPARPAAAPGRGPRPRRGRVLRGTASRRRSSCTSCAATRSRRSATSRTGTRSSRTSRTSSSTRRRRRCATSGRSRSKSSSTCSGRSSCSALLRVGRGSRRAARRDVRAPRHRFGRAHGRALPPGHRPVARVLRHRHPRAVAAHRRAPRDAPRPAPRHRLRPRRRALHGGAIAAAIALAFIWSTTSEHAGWQYRGGFALAAVLVAIVITSVTRAERHRATRCGAVESRRCARSARSPTACICGTGRSTST